MPSWDHAATPQAVAPAQAPSVPGAVTGIGSAAAANVAVQQLAGSEVNLLAMTLNVVAQPIKQLPFINERYVLPVLLLVIGVAIAFVVTQFDVHRAILHGGAAAWTSLVNYRALRVAGVSPFSPASTSR